jgi:putative heme-binding domain-containing protein
MVARAAALARDAGADEAARRDALSLLGHARWEDAQPALEAVIREAGDALRGVAARALAMQGRPEAFAILLDGWSRQGVAARREAAGALLGSREGALALLAAVEDGRVPAAELGAARIAGLIEDRREDVRARARKLLGGGAAEERRAVIERYRAALAREGADAARGRAVFERHCASCHRVGALGVAVGPDITDVQAKDPDVLLVDILDPGRAIDGSYVQHAVRLGDGTVVTGLIAAEAGSSLMLRRADGETLVIPRDRIEEVRASGASFMPDGIEKVVSVDEMADLIAFLRDGRYLEGAPPLLRAARPAGAAGAQPASGGSPRAE